MSDNLRVAVVQAVPSVPDAIASASIAAALIREAASNGARFVAFPEAFIGRLPGSVGGPGTAVALDGPECETIREAAASAGAIVGVCVVEQDGGRWHSTGLLIDGSKRSITKHRKLLPFGRSDAVWGEHSASNLMLLEAPFGKVGAAIGAESFAPACREALFDQDLSICYAPGWDHNDTWLSTMKYMASEGRCFVVSACHTGAVIAPDAASIASESRGNGILYFDLDLSVRHAGQTKRITRANRPARFQPSATPPVRRPGPPQFHP